MAPLFIAALIGILLVALDLGGAMPSVAQMIYAKKVEIGISREEALMQQVIRYKAVEGGYPTSVADLIAKGYWTTLDNSNGFGGVYTFAIDTGRQVLSVSTTITDADRRTQYLSNTRHAFLPTDAGGGVLTTNFVMPNPGALGAALPTMGVTPVSAVAPSATLNTYWYDTSSGTAVLKISDGANWVTANSTVPAPSAQNIVGNATALPATGSNGDVRYVYSDVGNVMQLYVFYNGTWVLSTSNAAACPGGYIAVPAFTLPSGTYVPLFCVMKYEAKKDRSSAGDREIGGPTGALPISVAAGAPWILMTWQDAKAGCAATGAHLITENQWLSLAHQVTTVGSNWSSGEVGNGFVFYGSSDSAPAAPIAADSDDANGYYGTGDSATGPDSGDLVGAFTVTNGILPPQSYLGQRRTLTLPNGQVIWDLAGNVWEWIDETIASTSRYNMGTAQWLPYVQVGAWPWASEMPLDKLPPKGYSVAQGMGQYFTGQQDPAPLNTVLEAPDFCVGDCAPVTAFFRGGSFNYGETGGIFSLRFDRGRSSPGTGIGFRCTK